MILIKVESLAGTQGDSLALKCQRNIKEVVPFGSLPRSEKKSKRVFKLRDQGF